MRALVVANGEPPSAALARQLRAGAALVVAADGGADVAHALGVEVDAAVGDLDSITRAARARLGGPRLHRDLNPDTTDLQKAVAFCLARGASAIDVIAAGAGRADHALANLSLLVIFRGAAAIRIVDDLFEVSVVDGAAAVDGPPGTVVSLVAIGECRGVTTHGLRWDLSDHTLQFSPLGVHNEIARPPATISVAEGDLLLFKGRWVERHR